MRLTAKLSLARAALLFLLTRAALSPHGAQKQFPINIEQGVELLRPRGRLAFITSGSRVQANFGASLRRFLSATAKLESMVDFGEFQPFEDVEMIRPSIRVLSMGTLGGEMRLFKWLTAGRPPEALSDDIAKAPTVGTDRLAARAWELETDHVFSDLVKQAYALTRAEIALKWQTAPPRRPIPPPGT